MAITVLILGEVGTGKTTSIRNLDPKETFIVSVLNKPLPFKGASKIYVQKEGGNYFSTDDRSKIISIIKKISNERKEIKNIIIDDFQYVMGNEFMRRATEKGYEKFSQIGQMGWEIINTCALLRNDICCFILSHSEPGQDGVSRMKTIGKIATEKGDMEGMVPIILHSLIVEKEYKFLTNHDGLHVARTPLDMYKERYIKNDLLEVRKIITQYYEFEDVPQ
jgi:hypothetical protein